MRFTRLEHQIADMLGRIDAAAHGKQMLFWRRDGHRARARRISSIAGRWEIGELIPTLNAEFSRSSNGSAP